MGASSDLFGIGTSALIGYQRTLATTSHNISNVQNENYSRQRVDITTNPAARSGLGLASV
jgi:flagellar hook-associated protein 1 FlgK